MKAIALHQPYATLVAIGVKTIETRKYRTHHRGNLMICSTKTLLPNWKDIILHYWTEFPELNPDLLPLGKGLAIVNVTNCRPMVNSDERSACCPVYPSAWSWQLSRERIIFNPVFDVKCGQGFFYIEIPDNIELELSMTK